MTPAKLFAALPALAATAAFLAGCGGSEDSESSRSGGSGSISISGLYPAFDPEEERYVSRCGRGEAPIRVEAADGASVAVGSAPPRSGTFEVDPRTRPGHDFSLVVHEGDDRRAYDVRCLPAHFPRWRFELARETAPGLFTVSFQPSQESRSWVIVFDHQGVPRWWYRPNTRALWAQVLDDGAVSWARSFGDGYGLDPRMAHEVRSLSGEVVRVVDTKGSIVDGHEFEELPNGNVLVATYDPAGRIDLRRFGGPARAAAVFAEIQEIDRGGQTVWHWNSRRHIGLEETGRWWRNVLSNAKRSSQGRATFDPVHINAIEPRGSRELVISTRHTDAVYGIDRSSGEIAWKLGGTQTPESLRIVGDPAHKLFGGQHDVRVGADGRISVYDNGKDRPRRPRVVHYELDLGQRTATYRGQLNDPRIRTSHCCGSARPLPGGGWLVSWGDNSLITGFDPEGRIAFRLSLPTPSFRAVPIDPGSTSLAALDRGLEAMERGAGG